MIRRLFASIAPVWQLWLLTFYQTTLQLLDPLDPRVPGLVRKVNHLESQRSSA